MTSQNATPEGEDAPLVEEVAQQPSRNQGASSHSFGDAAAEMANETEVEGGFETVAEQPPQPPEEELNQAKQALAERTADLQRLQAEYVNYKKRVDRDRELVRENAKYTALAPITDVLDTIDRARDHGPLEDGFKVVAEQLERIVSGLGLTKFGAVGDPFDPTLHEALSHIGEDPAVEVTTCKVIAKAGYRVGDRVVRAAQVLVVDPVELVVEVDATDAESAPVSDETPSESETGADSAGA